MCSIEDIFTYLCRTSHRRGTRRVELCYSQCQGFALGFLERHESQLNFDSCAFTCHPTLPPTYLTPITHIAFETLRSQQPNLRQTTRISHSDYILNLIPEVPQTHAFMSTQIQNLKTFGKLCPSSASLRNHLVASTRRCSRLWMPATSIDRRILC